MIDSMIANQLQKDRQNAVISKPDSNFTGYPQQLIDAIVKVDNGNNTYQVAILGKDGATEVKTFDGVFSSVSKNVNDIVVLKFTSPTTCEILATGGGGTSCSMTINALGIIYE